MRVNLDSALRSEAELNLLKDEMSRRVADFEICGDEEAGLATLYNAVGLYRSFIHWETKT